MSPQNIDSEALRQSLHSYSMKTKAHQMGLATPGLLRQDALSAHVLLVQLALGRVAYTQAIWYLLVRMLCTIPLNL